MPENDFIERIEEKPLSDYDIKQIAGNDLMVIPYSHLKTVGNLKQLFKLSDACVILYKQEPSYGHWVSLVFHPDTKKLFYFDSYGKNVDHWLRQQSTEKRRQLGQEHDYLTSLIDRAMISGMIDGVYVNSKQLQSRNNHIANCGRYAALRALFQNLTNEEFVRIITDTKGYGSVADKNVSLMTSLLA